MNEYMCFDSEAEAKAWLAAVDARLGYPNPATMTQTYSDVVAGEDGKFYVPINATCPAEERAKVQGVRRLSAGEVELTEFGLRRKIKK